MEKDSQKKSKVVQTYAEDMAKVIESNKEGLVKKIIHDEEQHEEEKRNLSPQSKKNEFFMLFGLILILTSFTALFFFFSTRDVPSIPEQEQSAPIIFTDKSALLEVAGLKKGEIEKKVLEEISTTTVKVGGVEAIYLTVNKSLIGLRKFIVSIDGNFVPGDRNFVDDNFLMGVVNSKIKSATPDTPASPALGGSQGMTVSFLRAEPVPPTSKDFFILLKIRSIADIFNAMRTWENKMFPDLHGFLGIDLSPDTKYLLTKNFEDGIVENKNARILYDKENKMVIMYVFADDNSVIITTTENAVDEIMLRLASSRVKK
ncbi:MAG TPA: hypothetical protein VJH06_03830 [Candidatus Paceibacterota bacterium]